MWQLSLHALREVHQRTFPADVASNPLTGSLTDVAFSHAAALLPITKARITLERRRFLTNVESAVQTQTIWPSLAHEMTAVYRGLCAEDAYLQQELEKLQDMRNKAKTDAEMWDERAAGSSQSSHLASKATPLWESLLSRKSQHEVLASGPIEDLIADRAHRRSWIFCIIGCSSHPFCGYMNHHAYFISLSGIASLVLLYLLAWIKALSCYQASLEIKLLKKHVIFKWLNGPENYLNRKDL